MNPGEVIAGRYEIRQRIGAGGMGAVYEVEHQITKRVGALKMLHPEFAQMESVVERFIREASAAGRIGSPHIIDTYDAGRLEDGVPYIFMELLSGRNLEDIVEQDGPMHPADAVDLVRQACRALKAAHESGIVHRDIKPENLFVVNESTEPLVKVLDFGISKFDPELTNAGKMTVEGQSIGTPHYMSPEQVMGRADVDGRTDVYSLAVTLYFLLTGELPFIAETLPAMSVLIHAGKCVTVAQHRPEVPLELSETVAKAMAVNRDDRYATMEEFSVALAAFSTTGRASNQSTQQLNSIATDGTIISDRPPTMHKGTAAVVASVPPPSSTAESGARHSGGERAQLGAAHAPSPPLAPQPAAQATAPAPAGGDLSAKGGAVSGGTVNPVTETLAGVPRASSRTPLLIGGAVALAAGVALVVTLWGGAGAGEEEGGAAAQAEGDSDVAAGDGDVASSGDGDVAATDAAGERPSKGPASVTLTITGAPKGARIYYRDALVSDNPFRVEPADVSRALRVEAEGFQPTSLMIEPSRDRTIQVELEPLPRAVSRPTPRPASAPAAQPQPSGELKKGRLGSQFTSEFE